MHSKFLLAASVVALCAALVVATLVAAGGDVTVTMYDSIDCSTPGKVMAKFPDGKCSLAPSNASQSGRISCVPTPKLYSTCFYQTMYNSSTAGGAACDPNNILSRDPMQCGKCYSDGAASFDCATVNGVTTYTMKAQCNKDCSVCNVSLPIPADTCMKDMHLKYSKPFACPQSVHVESWDNPHCEGAPAAGSKQVVPSNVCIGISPGKAEKMTCDQP